MGRKKVLERVKEEVIRSEEERKKKMVMLDGVGWLNVLGRWLEYLMLSKECLMLVLCRRRKKRRRYLMIEFKNR